MLVVFKSAPILKRTLKVKHAMLQLYVLKLLKMQTKYLGRQWRKSNMKTMSAIYTKVRHRLNDDWAYGNGKNEHFLFQKYENKHATIYFYLFLKHSYTIKPAILVAHAMLVANNPFSIWVPNGESRNSVYFAFA